MNNRIFIIIVIVFQSFFLNATDYISIFGVNKQIDTLEYRVLGPAISYTKFRLPDYSISAYMLTVDLNNPYNLVETFQAQNQLGKTEAMTAAYHRLNKPQHETIAGVNGNFWIVSGQGQPTELLGIPHSGSILNGEILTDPNNWNRGHGEIGFTMLDRAKKMWIDDISFSGTVKIDGVGEYPISEVNRIRQENELVLFNAYLGANQATRTDDNGTEVFIKPVSGQNWATNKDVRCKVTRKTQNKGANLLEAGESVLSGNGNAKIFLENLSVGSELTVNMGISTLTDNQYPLVEQMITGNALVMKNGELTSRNYNEEYNTMLYPRTGVASSEDGKTLYLIVIDKGAASVGANTETMCGILKACGAHNATSMDGGGSAQMMLDGTIVNQPADGKERAVANGWFLFHNAPADDNVVEIRFADRKKEISTFSIYEPVVLAYNRYGVLIDKNLKNYTLSCSAEIGYVTEDNVFIATGTGKNGTLTVEYNGASVSKEIKVKEGELSFRLDSVLINNVFEYPIEVFSISGNDVSNVAPHLLAWTIDDNEICTVENGILKGLKNGTTIITGSLGNFESKMKVTVEIPQSGIFIHDSRFTDSWTLSASSQLAAVFSTSSLPAHWSSGIGVDFVYDTGRAPFIKIVNNKPLYSLPDSIKIVLNSGEISIDKAVLSLRANNTKTSISNIFSNFKANGDTEISFAIKEYFATEDIAIYPVWFDNINFYLNSQTAGKSYTLGIKEIQLIYNGFPVSSIRNLAESTLFAFPNPVAGNEIYVNLVGKFGKTEYAIYDLSGQKFLSGIAMPAFGNSYCISLEGLTSGVYFIDIIQGERKKETVKIIKY